MYSYIPITSRPNNTFNCKIPVDGRNISLTFKTTYNEIAAYWSVSIITGEGVELVHNIPVVPGQNILEQFEYMGIGSAYIVYQEETSDEWPNSENLGGTWKLVWGDTK